MTKNDGGPAFPCKVATGKRVVYSEEERGNVFESTFTDVPGMTLRDYFAAHLNDDAPPLLKLNAQKGRACGMAHQPALQRKR